jgi:Fic family protein
MSINKPDIEADISTAVDRCESIGLMEPLRIGEGAPQRGALIDLAVDLAARAAGFRRSLPDGVRVALADLVRAMNCYYSNLLEGHDTHPIEIERALKNDYSTDPRKRDLQLEAKAHIAVQRWIDAGGVTGRAVSMAGIQEMHRRFCAELPQSLLWVEDPGTAQRIKLTPGELRTRDVKVAAHVSISPGAVPRFMAKFEEGFSGLGKTDAILSAAAAHHRLVWIHPFLDGNGRVARLMSHASLLEALDTGGIWSVARGLARNAEAYKSHLAACDMPRRNDLDGRGALSQESLAEFTRFYLEICLDQIRFMEELVQPDRLRARILLWAEEEIRFGLLPPKSGQVFEAVLYRGALPRSDAANVVGTGERQARRIVAALMKRGVLTASSPRAPLHLAFPATLAARWMPGLFPDTPNAASS